MSKAKVAVGAVVGAVAGFVTGILLAPKSGKETRKDIKVAGVKAKDEVVRTASNAKDTAAAEAQKIRAKAEEVIGDVSDKAGEVKGRVEQAVEGAQKGFSKKPKANKKQ